MGKKKKAGHGGAFGRRNAESGGQGEAGSSQAASSAQDGGGDPRLNNPANNAEWAAAGAAAGGSGSGAGSAQSQRGPGSGISLPSHGGPPGTSSSTVATASSATEMPGGFKSQITRSKKASGQELTTWRRSKKQDKNYEDNENDPDWWAGSKLLDSKTRNQMKDGEDKSLVPLDSYIHEKLNEMDEDARSEGKRLYRPSFVSENPMSTVTLWANYFPIKLDPEHVSALPTCYSYKFEVARVDEKTKHIGNPEAQNGSSLAGEHANTTQSKLTPQVDEKAEPPSESEAQNPTKNNVKPRLVKILLQAVLNSIATTGDYATDFKENIVFLKKVDFKSTIPEVTFITSTASTLPTAEVRHSLPGSRPTTILTYKVHFLDEQQYDVGRLENTLRTGNPKEAAQAAAKLGNVISMVMGHELRTDRNVAVIGGSRFFKQDASQRVHVDTHTMLAILRGFSLNVRPATNRLLVNVNATCSVFRPRINIGRWLCIWRWERQWNTNSQHKTDDLRLLHKIISRIRILYKDPGKRHSLEAGGPESTSPTWSDASDFGPLSQTEGTEFSIAGFARATDGCTRNCNRSRDGHSGDRCDAACKVQKKDRGIEIDEDFASARQARFRCGKEQCSRVQFDGHKLFHSVEEFLPKDHIAYSFKYNDIPLINRGTAERPEYIPAERCWIAFGQPARTNLDERHCERLMIKFACRKPYRNAKAICEDGYSMLKLGSENTFLEKLGISVDKNLVTVEGRVLLPPKLSYHQQDRTVLNGAWNMKKCKVLNPCSSKKKWAWIGIEYDRGELRNVEADHGITEFRKQLQNMGIQLSEHVVATEERTLKGENSTCLENLHDQLRKLKEKPVDLVLIVVPKSLPVEFYNKIKFLGDVVHGIHTACLIDHKFGKRAEDYFANVALKVNLKLGGKNHELFKESTSQIVGGFGKFPSLRGMPAIGSTMVIGYDVIHPTGSETEGMQSQVGFVASVDVEELSQWQGHYWSQKAKTEMLDDNITETFKESVRRWGRRVESLPENIVIFRDGVSESQYATVLREELGLIKKTCLSIADDPEMKDKRWSPKITLVVSVKRHSTRFYPTGQASMNKKSGNIKAGTVVDRSVTQARFWEFFLTAQDAIKGTARPTRYVVLHDDIFRRKFKASAAAKLEEFTHKLSYMFGRATKAVRLCTPAYHADILCTRARAYESVLKDNDVKTELCKGISDKTWARVREGKIHPDIKESMFWV